MQSSSEKSQSFIEIFFIPISAISSPFLNSLSELSPDQPSTSHDIAVLGGDVSFHSRAFINGELFALVDGATETRIVFAGIFIVGVIL